MGLAAAVGRDGSSSDGVIGTALSRCVGQPGEFLAGAWGRRVHLHRGERYGDLLSLEHADRLISSSALRLPAFRLVRRGETLDPRSYTRHGRVGSRPITDLIDPGRVYRLFEEGATVVLQGLHRYWEPVTRFCRDLELTLTHPIQANAYLTPPVASGLNVHADGHDVFALQTHGSKHWVTYPRDPPGQAGDAAQPDSPPEHDLQLQPGDCLYVPRGVRHAARTVSGASLHLTVGVRAVTWREVLGRQLERRLRQALNDPGLDEALPAGFAVDPEALEELAAARLSSVVGRLATVDAGETARSACQRFWSARPALLSGQLEQLLGLDTITDDAQVRRRPGSVCRLGWEGGVVTLELGDRLLRMPAALDPALRWIAARERFRVCDLAEHLDEHDRGVLVRRLVREGLVVVEDGGGDTPTRG